MQRRTFLAAASAALPAVAGCLSGDDPAGTGSPDGDSPGTPGGSTDVPGEPTGTPGDDTPDDSSGGSDPDWAAIVDLETAPRTYALAPTGYRTDDGAEVEVAFVETATSEHPARVAATLHNPMDVEQTFRLRFTPPFGRTTSRQPRQHWEQYHGSEYTYRVQLVFAPTADHDLVDDPPAVERADDGYWRLAEGVSPWHPDTVRLGPDETIRGEYAVVGRAEGTGRGRPTGVYEFSRAHGRSVRIAVWDTERPGPDGQSRFAGESVPALPRDAGVAWYHEADATTPTYVRPSAERASLPAEVAFTFVNHDRAETSCGHWNLYKLHDGEWFHLGPYVQTADCRVVGPGGSKTWTLHAYSGEGLPCEGAAVFGHLGGGRYAAAAGYGHATGRSAAMVELAGDPVAVVPTGDASAERDGARVDVTTGAREREHATPATLTLTRVADAGETIIAEQVMRDRYSALRNALAFVEDGVERVVVHTSERRAQATTGYDSDVRTFRFRGQAYRARVDREAE